MSVDSRKWATPDQAAALVSPGDRVIVGGLGAAPGVLLEALNQRARELPDLTLLSGMMLGGYSFLSAGFPRLRYETWFMPSILGTAGDLPSGSVDLLPLSWTQVLRLLDNEPSDVALVQTSPPDRHGWLSLGISTSYTLPAVRKAKRVIAQVNSSMPRTFGDSFIHESEVHTLVEGNRALPEFPTREVDETGRAIARNAAGLIRDGVVLQPGIGALPNEVLIILSERQADIQLHSIVTDGGIALAEFGFSRGRRATVGEVIGSERLYAWVSENPAVRMAGGNETHDISALTSLSSFVSLNSAIEIDMFGQANVEYLGGQAVGGVGGSIDFMIGAAQPGNLSIIALPSAVKGGKVSRIKACLDPGPVSIPRTMTQIIVTEYGVADLRGCSVRQRAERLLAISHPDHRDELAEEWRRIQG